MHHDDMFTTQKIFTFSNYIRELIHKYVVGINGFRYEKSLGLGLNFLMGLRSFIEFLSIFSRKRKTWAKFDVKINANKV